MAQSFFDKLTGTLKVKEEGGVPATTSSASVAPAQAQQQPEEKSIQPKIIAEQPIMQTLKEKSKEEASWHSEVEGQLTVDVYQTPGEIVVKSTIAGVTIEDLDISITNDMVTIRGERKKDEEVRQEDYFHQECYWGPFSRSVILPMDIDSENAVASFKNGILTIKLPKAEKVKTRKIKIAGN